MPGAPRRGAEHGPHPERNDHKCHKARPVRWIRPDRAFGSQGGGSSEEHTTELQSLMRISYAVFCSNNEPTVPLCRSQEHTPHNPPLICPLYSPLLTIFSSSSLCVQFGVILFFVYGAADPGSLHVLTPPLPTRRSSCLSSILGWRNARCAAT